MVHLDRRRWLSRLGLGLAALPLAKLGCGGDDEPLGPDAATPDGSLPGDGWASGGTGAMTDKSSYPDPFTGALASCAIVSQTTEGPCTTASDLAREDISEGWTGLPVRLGLKVVDGSCQPLAGAIVKIWHTNLEGIYSGQTPNPGMCTGNIQDYIAMDFMRGVQPTDAAGVAYFDTCFPGWYRGRAVHVHFQIKQGNASTRISQLFFPEDVTREIFASHPEYRGFGQPDTTFTNDNILAPIGGDARARLILDVARMTDGAMLASKVVAVV